MQAYLTSRLRAQMKRQVDGMEKNLEAYVEEMLKSPKVTGVVVADRNGLCLTAKGTATQESAGVITSLMQEAQTMNSEEKDPIVVVETDTGKLMIKSVDKVTVGIYEKCK